MTFLNIHSHSNKSIASVDSLSVFDFFFFFFLAFFLFFSQMFLKTDLASSLAKEISKAFFTKHENSLLFLARSRAVAQNSLTTSQKIKMLSSVCFLKIIQ